MKKILSVFILALCFPFPAHAQDDKADLKEMLAVINSSLGDVTLYEPNDVPVENRNQFDFNNDGTAEWVIVPKTACGDTNNCTYFIMQKDKKGKWFILHKGDGKITSLSPWGIIITPRKTNGYFDFITVFDQGPEGNGTRSLEQTVYTWEGKKYEKYTGTYPPPGSPPELSGLMTEINKLKYERGRGNKPVVQ